MGAISFHSAIESVTQRSILIKVIHIFQIRQALSQVSYRSGDPFLGLELTSPGFHPDLPDDFLVLWYYWIKESVSRNLSSLLGNPSGRLFRKKG